jgi:hypothetical protein
MGDPIFIHYKKACYYDNVLWCSLVLNRPFAMVICTEYLALQYNTEYIIQKNLGFDNCKLYEIRNAR